MAIITVNLSDLVSTLVSKFNQLSAGVGDISNLNGGADSDVVSAINNIANNSDFTTASIGTLTVTTGSTLGGTSTVETLSVTGNTTLGNATSDTITATGRFASAVTPSTDNTYDLGAVGNEWRDLFIDGTANIDSLVADTADINGGTIDNTIIGAATPVAGTFTNLTVTGDLLVTGSISGSNSESLIPGTDNAYDIGSVSFEWRDLFIDGTANIDSLIADTADINGGTIDGVVIGGAIAGAGTFTTLVATGNVDIGDATSDTVTITARVDSHFVPATDNSYDLGAAANEWRDLYIDGTANIDSLVADTADINGGTVDGVTIGGASAGAGTFTTLVATGNVDIGNATSDTVTITARVDSHFVPSADNTYDLGAVGVEWKDLYVDGIAYVDAINLNGVTITSSAAELNYVTGVTSAIQTQLNTKAPTASPSLSGTVTLTGGANNWTVVASGSKITFSYNGVARMSLDGSNGNLVVTGNVTAYGSP